MWVISTCVSTFRSHTVLSNVLQAHFHRGAIDTNMESLKEYFSTLVILYIQTEATEEYKDFVMASRNNTIDILLDKSSEK